MVAAMSKAEDTADVMSKVGIGQPVLRFEDRRLLTGEGRFMDDVNLPGQAYAVILRARHLAFWRTIRAQMSWSMVLALWRQMYYANVPTARPCSSGPIQVCHGGCPLTWRPPWPWYWRKRAPAPRMLPN